MSVTDIIDGPSIGSHSVAQTLTEKFETVAFGGDAVPGHVPGNTLSNTLKLGR